MQDKKKILIIGGVAGGASAAARARRLAENAEIIIFERGPYISFANCGLPYHIGGEIVDREQLLLQTPEQMRQRFNIDVRINSEVLAIDREQQELEIIDHSSGKRYRESYDALVLSPGAQPVKPPIPGSENSAIFTLRSIPDMDAINNFIINNNCKNALVIGGGYIGLEMAEALRHRNLAVTLVELAEQVMGPIDKEMANLLHQELQLNGIDLRLAVSVTKFVAADHGVQAEFSDGRTADYDLVILAIGVKPEINLAKDAGLAIGALGGIVVNANMRTNDSNIYAVGDAVEITEFVSGKPSLIPLAGPANRQGRIAANNIFGRDSKYNNTQGTGICKVFNQTVGMTGLNEKLLQKFNLPFEKIYIHPASHAGYYPGATPISLKLLFNPKDGKILGAQAVGLNGIDKRIDVLALAIRHGLTVYDLEEIELSYAPPYGSAKDVINYAGFVAANSLRGDVAIIHAEDVAHLQPSQLLLDVRTADEVEAGTISGAVNIPIDELRERLAELPREKEIIAFCKVGLRGYLACRILQQHGWRCRNLSGGYTSYLLAANKILTTAVLPQELHSDTGEIEESIYKHLDACGLQCPGPIQKLKQTIDAMAPGEIITVSATDPGFVSDLPAWCNSTGNKLLKVKTENGVYIGTIRKARDIEGISTNSVTSKIASRKMSLVVFSGDFDKAMAAFIIANGAVAMGYEVTMFFTFWGLNILRRDNLVATEKTFIERMFARMMPRGANKIVMSKMNMLGMGTAMIKKIMKNKGVSSLPELINSAQTSGVKLVACAMTMDLMGIKPQELLDKVEQGGVAMYLDKAGESGVNLFI